MMSMWSHQFELYHATLTIVNEFLSSYTSNVIAEIKITKFGSVCKVLPHTDPRLGDVGMALQAHNISSRKSSNKMDHIIRSYKMLSDWVRPLVKRLREIASCANYFLLSPPWYMNLFRHFTNIFFNLLPCTNFLCLVRFFCAPIPHSFSNGRPPMGWELHCSGQASIARKKRSFSFY